MAIEKDALIQILKNELNNKDSEIRKAIEEIITEQVKSRVKRCVHRGTGRNHYGLKTK
jgi:hypothetical protein